MNPVYAGAARTMSRVDQTLSQEGQMHADATRQLLPFRAWPFLKDAADAAAIQLTPRQRHKLEGIATRMRLTPRTIVYHEAAPADSIFAVTDGVVKSYRELRSGRRIVSAFLFPRDLFGLAERGYYVTTTRAITSVIVYRLPVKELAALLKHDGDLQYPFLAKATHELRESQRR